MFGQLPCWPVPLPGAGAVVAGLAFVPVEGVGLAAARAGTEKATMAPRVAAPTTGAAMSITLRLNGITAS
jgi:hypothetical protein